MVQYTVIDAPSNLGLRPTGVETLPIAVKSAGLIPRLGAIYGGRVATLPYKHDRDPQTHVRNGEAIHTYSRHLADTLMPLVQGGQFPIVLGGDCSILLGVMLALRRAGRHGLFFLDGHADFYQAEADLNGEVASMDLAIVSGRGPALLANMEGLQPLVRDEDSVVFGFRDAEAATREGSQDVRSTAMHTYDLAQARMPDAGTAADQALAHLVRDDLAGFWIHFDADVLDDAIMPAVDYRMPGGLQFDEVSAVLRRLVGSGRAVGLSLTIFNPLLDQDGSLAQALVDCLVAGLAPQERPPTADD
jgi:arginase